MSIGSEPGRAPQGNDVVVTKPVVVLFDVDETLVHTGGSGARSWGAAFEKLHGVVADIGQHTSAGETDPQVARETFRGVLGRDPTAEELDTLPGVGPVTAEKITAYRDQHGPFTSLDGLDAIPGIGPARIASLKGLAVP